MNDKDNIKKEFRNTLNSTMSFIRILLILLAVLYLLSGIYSVSSNEIGVLQRFGRVLDDTIPPGIHYAFPRPVDRVTKVPIRIVDRLLINDLSSEGASTRSSYCLTGDNNIVTIQCVIQYNISDPFDYLFKVAEPRKMLRSMAVNTMIQCLARMPIDHALTKGKLEIANTIKSGVQQRLDQTECGLSVSFVELRDLTPPIHVQPYFSDVVNAGIDKEKMINQAHSYRNERIPAANAQANQIVQSAEAYKTEVVLKAEGETHRFESFLERLENQGASVRRMIYVDTMKEIMKRVGAKHVVTRNEEGKTPAHLKLFSK